MRRAGQNRLVSTDRAAFVRSHLRAGPVAFVPEITLYQAEEPIGLWELTEGEYRSVAPPPFWAFAWAGGQALARYVLDHPDTVAGASVLDLASGGGLVAIAAARAGAATVRAVEIDPLAIAAIEINAACNGVDIQAILGDVLDGAADADVVLAGDVFYSKAMAEQVLEFLRRAARAGAEVLVGDPGRAYLPARYCRELHRYDIPVRYELESTRVRTTTIWRLSSAPTAVHQR